MKLELELSDETVEALATAIASKITVNGATAEAAEENDDDLLGGDSAKDAKPAMTLDEVQDLVRGTIGAGKDKAAKDAIKTKVKAVLKKFDVAAVSDMDAANYEKFAAELKKIK